MKGRRPSAAANTQPVWLSVEEDSISILEGETLVRMAYFIYIYAPFYRSIPMHLSV